MLYNIQTLSEKCGSLPEQLMSLQNDLVAKDNEKKTLQDQSVHICNNNQILVFCSVFNMERDLKQKRQLLTDQKKKLVSLEVRTNLDKEKIVC